MKDLLEFLEKHFGLRPAVELVLFLAGFLGARYLAQRFWEKEKKAPELFALSGWFLVGAWYFFISYGRSLGRAPFVSTAFVLVLLSATWLVALWKTLRGPTRKIAQAMKAGDKLKDADLYAAAIRNYEEALTVASGRDKKLAVLECHLKIADCATLLGELEQAREHYLGTIRVALEAKKSAWRAHALRGLGNLETKLGNNDLARQHYGEARGLFKKEGNRLGEANVLHGLGDLERTLGNNDLARQHYGEARGLSQKVGNRLGEANVDFSEGTLLGSLGHPEQAKQMLLRAQARYAQLGMHEWAERARRAAEDLGPEKS